MPGVPNSANYEVDKCFVVRGRLGRDVVIPPTIHFSGLFRRSWREWHRCPWWVDEGYQAEPFPGRARLERLIELANKLLANRMTRIVTK